MTTDSSSLETRHHVVPTTLGGQLAGLKAFIRRPSLPDRVTGITPAAIKATGWLLVIDIAIMAILLMIVGAVVALGVEMPKNALEGLKLDWKLVLMIVVGAPVGEELLFRSWMSGRPGHVLALIAALAGIVGTVVMQTQIPEANPLMVAGSLFAGLIAAMLLLFLLRGRPPMGWFRRIFPVLFWLGTLGFAGAHLFNYQAENVAVLLPLVIPQFVTGAILAYARMTHGMWSNVALHMLHNGIAIALAAASGQLG